MDNKRTVDLLYGRSHLLLPVGSMSVDELHQTKSYEGTISGHSVHPNTPITSQLKRGVSPRCKPNYHYARVVANILCHHPCDRPITAPGIYADPEPCFMLVTDISTEEELRNFLNTKYGARFDKKDIFRLPPSFDPPQSGEDAANEMKECVDCSKSNVQLLQIFSDNYKSSLLNAKKSDSSKMNKFNKYHVHGKGARVETEYEYEFEPEYLVEFDIGKNGEIIYKTDPFSGDPLYFLDTSGNKVVKIDKHGNTIYKLDRQGKKIPMKDELGGIVYKLDSDGNKIVRRDEIGTPVYRFRMGNQNMQMSAPSMKMLKFPPTNPENNSTSKTDSKSVEQIQREKADKPQKLIEQKKEPVNPIKSDHKQKKSVTQSVRAVVDEKHDDEHYFLNEGDGEKLKEVESIGNLSKNKSDKSLTKKLKFKGNSLLKSDIKIKETMLYMSDGGGDTAIQKENLEIKGVNKQLKVKLKELTKTLEKKKSKPQKKQKNRRMDGSGDSKGLDENETIGSDEEELQQVYKSLRNVIKKQLKIARDLTLMNRFNELKPSKPELKPDAMRNKQTKSKPDRSGRTSYHLLIPKLHSHTKHPPSLKSVRSSHAKFDRNYKEDISSTQLPPEIKNILQSPRKPKTPFTKVAKSGSTSFLPPAPTPSLSELSLATFDSIAIQKPFSSPLRHLRVTPTPSTSKECIEAQKLQEAILAPTVSDIMLIVETLYPRQTWVKGKAVAVRYYPDGKVFCTSYPNGSGQIFYPGGSLALVVSAPNPVNVVLVIRDPADEFFLPDRAIIGDFNTIVGTGLVTVTEGMGKQKYKLHYDHLFGRLEGSNNFPKRWSWSQGGTRLTLKINRYFSLRVMNLNQVHLIFNGNQRGLRVNVGKTEFPIVLQTVRGIRESISSDDLMHRTTTAELLERSSLYILDKSKYLNSKGAENPSNWGRGRMNRRQYNKTYGHEVSNTSSALPLSNFCFAMK